MRLRVLPDLFFVLKVTSIVPSPPGGTFLDDTRTAVHPHPAFTFSIKSGAFPVFLNTKECLSSGPETFLPKSCSTFTNSSLGRADDFSSLSGGCVARQMTLHQKTSIPANNLCIQCFPLLILRCCFIFCFKLASPSWVHQCRF